MVFIILDLILPMHKFIMLICSRKAGDYVLGNYSLLLPTSVQKTKKPRGRFAPAPSVLIAGI